MSAVTVVLLICAVALAAFMDFRVLRAIYRFVTATFGRALTPASKEK